MNLDPTNKQPLLHKEQFQKKSTTVGLLKSKVKTMNKQMTALEALSEGSLKEDFINDYGIQMEMPANYIYESFFYRPDHKFVINAYCQILPQNIQFLDFNKIDQNEDPKVNNFLEQQKEFSNQLCFKVYEQESDKYQQISQRKCDSSYQDKLCFSEDKTRLAIFRLDKSDNPPNNTQQSKKTMESSNNHVNIFKQNQRYVIDVFDCSTIQFFTNKKHITPKDPCLLYTIWDDDLQSAHKFENAFIRFSHECKYLYINQSRKSIKIFSLIEKQKDILQPIKQVSLPSIYEAIVNFGIDEYDLDSSLICAKKTDFRNIEVFPLKMLEELNDQYNTSIRSSLVGTKDLVQIMSKYPVSSIRIDHFDINRTNMRFSQDMTQVIYCDDTQHILLEIAQQGIKQHQKSINHLKNKTTRYITKFGDSEFLISVADAQDKCISIRHSQDPSKKIKFYFRFKEGSVMIRDIYHFNDRVRILVTRDDEEFIIYEYQNFEVKETFWQRFLESSNYIFEWPYLCYLKGQNHIMIQNAFNTEIAFYIEPHDLQEGGIISNMFVSDLYLLYVVISTKTEYLIYEKDLDLCMPYIFNKDDANQTPKNLTNPDKILAKQKPIARISKEYLNYKSIYKIYVRSPSSKEVIQTNEDRIIFFLCDFKIYSINAKKIQIVDTGYKFREVRRNLLAYSTVDQNNKKTNEIKYLQIAHSDYQKFKIFEENEGKLLEYLVQDGQLLVLIKPEKSDQHFIKIFDVDNNYQLKSKFTISTSDQELIGNLQTINFYQGNMIPSCNDLYTIIQNEDKAVIHHYKTIIPCLPHSGNIIAFYSPQMNIVYRKMLYFVTNKKFRRSKRAIIIPYITDNYSVFNKRQNLTQFCTFNDVKTTGNMKPKTDIMCFTPFTKQILHYNLKGQVKSINPLSEIFQKYGESTVAVSTNGKLFLQLFEDEISRSNLNILKLYIDLDIKDSLLSSPLNEKEDEDFSSNYQSPEKIPSITQTRRQNNSIQSPRRQMDSKVKIQLKDNIKLDQISIINEKYQRLNKFYLNELVSFFTSQGCEVIYKINDNHDILIGFIYISKLGVQSNTSKKVIKDLILLKKVGDSRHAYFLRPEHIQEGQMSQDDLQKKQKTDNDVRKLKQKLMKNMHEIGVNKKDLEYTTFIEMNELFGCYDFSLTNDKIIMWSKTKIYSGDLSSIVSNNQNITLVKSTFEIENPDEAQIQTIYSSGQNSEDIQMGNFYCYIKLVVENSYAFIIKYNINKNKEFSSFDCSLTSQIFFDIKHEGYILDQDSIIDIDQGIPLYFYRSGMNDYQKQYLLQGDLSKGSRFCFQNLHFMVRNKVYMPYSYFTLILFDHFRGQTVNNDTYDPNSFYYFQGDTVLHTYANNYKGLEFILNKYHQTNPTLLNMLLIKDKNNQNVLQKAVENGNTRCVKLILDKLSAISMNNIHAIKQNFCDLIEYNGFEDYLRLCFFQTNQMKSKQIFQRKSDSEDKFFIGAHETSFLDKKFYENFQDVSQPTKQVVIRALDAGWILRSNFGQQFQIALSESDNMDYFAIETIQLIVNYQWKIMKPKITLWLFIPFIINMILYSVYCIYSYEELIRSQNHEEVSLNVLNRINQSAILLFSIQTTYIEFKQVTFHKREYIKSFWNLLDLTTVILAPLTVIMDLASVEPEYVRPFMAICNFIFYLRFFYFLRIFDASSHLVRTIIEITADIRYFLFVFFLAIIGFGGSFLILSNNNDPEKEGARFIESFPSSFIYSYRLGLGDFDIDPYAESKNSILLHAFFLLSSLFSAVILLNMLVAIMGESFNRVNETSEHQRVREHLQLIVENDFLINRKQLFKNVKYLIEIKDDVDDDEQDQITSQISSLEQVIKQTAKDSQNQLGDMKQLINLNTHKMHQMRHQLNEIMNYFKTGNANQINLHALDTINYGEQNSSRNSASLSSGYHTSSLIKTEE
eukprot:403355181